MPPIKPGLYPRRGLKSSFTGADAIEPGEIVMATDTNELGTLDGWYSPRATGGVLSVNFFETPAASQKISSSVPIEINGLTATLTPTAPATTFIIQATILTSATHVTSFFLYVNGEKQKIHANTNEAGANVTHYGAENTSTSYITTVSFSAKHIAVDSNPIIFSIRGLSAWGTSTYDLYINDRGSGDMRGVSTMIITEVP